VRSRNIRKRRPAGAAAGSTAGTRLIHRQLPARRRRIGGSGGYAAHEDAVGPETTPTPYPVATEQQRASTSVRTRGVRLSVLVIAPVARGAHRSSLTALSPAPACQRRVRAATRPQRRASSLRSLMPSRRCSCQAIAVPRRQPRRRAEEHWPRGHPSGRLYRKPHYVGSHGPLSAAAAGDSPLFPFSVANSRWKLALLRRAVGPLLELAERGGSRSINADAVEASGVRTNMPRQESEAARAVPDRSMTRRHYDRPQPLHSGVALPVRDAPHLASPGISPARSLAARHAPGARPGHSLPPRRTYPAYLCSSGPAAEVGLRFSLKRL
jgi:hypothetical protein